MGLPMEQMWLAHLRDALFVARSCVTMLERAITAPIPGVLGAMHMGTNATIARPLFNS